MNKPAPKPTEQREGGKSVEEIIEKPKGNTTLEGVDAAGGLPDEKLVAQLVPTIDWRAEGQKELSW